MFIHTLSNASKIFDGKIERFITKNGKSGCQTRVRQTIVDGNFVSCLGVSQVHLLYAVLWHSGLYTIYYILYSM